MYGLCLYVVVWGAPPIPTSWLPVEALYFFCGRVQVVRCQSVVYFLVRLLFACFSFCRRGNHSKKCALSKRCQVRKKSYCLLYWYICPTILYIVAGRESVAILLLVEAARQALRKSYCLLYWFICPTISHVVACRDLLSVCCW